jgi:hypothetical protein
MMPLWVIYFFNELEDCVPARLAYRHALGEDETLRLAADAMEPHEKRVSIAKVALKPGLELPPGYLLK